MNEFESRIAALERTNRRFRLAFAAIFLVAGTMAVFGFARKQVPDVLQAKRFEVLDDGDEAKVIISEKGGAGRVMIYDGKKKLAVSLTSDQGGIIRTNDASGTQTGRLPAIDQTR